VKKAKGRRSMKLEAGAAASLPEWPAIFPFIEALQK
jgi:hypothetical protein